MSLISGTKFETNNIVVAQEGVVLMLACKAANTSLKHALRDAGYFKKGEPFLNWTAAQCAESNHRKVAILRHPGERLISTWWGKVYRRDGKSDMLERHAPHIFEGMEFDEFVKVVFRITDRVADPHLRSQCFHRFHRGAYLPKRVFKIEEPSRNWWPELRKFLPRLASEMPVRNARTERPKLADLAGPAERDMITQRYLADFLLGGYPFM